MSANPCVLIVSPKVIARHQIAGLLAMHGWHSTCLNDASPNLDTAQLAHIHWVIVDITREYPTGAKLMRQLASQAWLGYLAGICEGGATPMMREARSLGFDGFFYLNRHGKAIDPQRGLAADLVRHGRHPHSWLGWRRPDNPPRRQRTIPPGSATTISTNNHRMAMDAAASG